MYIIYGHAELFLPYCSSLKEKRKIIKSIIDRIRKRFNISISEVKYQDLWQRSIIGFTAVSYNNAELVLFTDAIKDTLYNHAADMEITGFYYDIISQNL
ncbi:MAG: DUF503 domain-containing protein [Syntrophomonadaceae bacterium]|nr:DUF503 domain-containing protein [Syntrophomonadaceae bacterium]MDD3889689.1 DUF503 domain-containing protein [Syntrophomonadaceae bacterium]MDD4549840.1 DUF503 domain-containing protein [Syntrophomonadaceae bacterium]